MAFSHKKQNSETAILRCFRAYGLVTRTGIEPMIPPWKGDVLTSWPTGHVVAAVGFEPTTNRVWTEYSSQLSYAAINILPSPATKLLYYKFFEKSIVQRKKKLYFREMHKLSSLKELMTSTIYKVGIDIWARRW